jgi:hypothetical protein
MEYDAIADALIECQTEISLWQQRRETLLGQLSSAHQAGRVPTSWKHSGYSFTLSPGRKTVAYSDKAKLALENFKQSCLESGDASWKEGLPFWTVKVAR